MRWDAAYRCIADVEASVVYLIPDADTGVQKSERTGIWPESFPKVLAVQDSVL